LVALGLAVVALTSIDQFQELAGGTYSVQAIASAVAVVIFSGGLVAMLVRHLKR
jgi:hypothetical protein